MTGVGYSLLIIAVASLCTIAVRYAPFIVFRGKKEVPGKIAYLGKYLPPAIVATLVVYCLKDVDFSQFPSSLAEFISIAVVAALHLWKRNTLLSIGGGTLCYMILTRTLFA